MKKSDIIRTLETADSAPPDPFALFREWLADAERAEPSDYNAMALATVDVHSKPSVRTVLLKNIDETGFSFYTNKQSRKGRELAENPFAALCFHWKALERDVRVEGRVMPLTDAENDDYFATRSTGSRLGAWASSQSQPLQSRTELQRRLAGFAQKFGELVPRPPHWGGYRLTPDRIEFWHEGADRLHTRLLYLKTGKGWDRQMLFP